MIQIEGLSKSFGEKQVIQDLSFEVFKGEVFAFLGANGSGKTTTIRCLLNIYQPDQGKLLINGEKFSVEMSSMLGYLPEERGLYLTNRVLETLVFFGQLKGLHKQDATQRSLEYLERVGLKDKANLEIKRLSSGQQQKIQLGITILNRPQLLILDEPTKGLDPLNRSLLMDMLLELNRAGSTIVFITHQMDEVERIADRLVMIKDGQRVLYGEVEKVKRDFGENVIHLHYSGELPENMEMYSFRSENHEAEIRPNQGIDPQVILKYLVSENVWIDRFETASPSLNEIFLEISKT